MGLGDDLMGLGEAVRLFQTGRTGGRKVAFGDPENGRAFQSPVYERARDFVATQTEADSGRVYWHDNFQGHRPYIDYPATAELARQNRARLSHLPERAAVRAGRQWAFREYQPVPPPRDVLVSQRDVDRGRALIGGTGGRRVVVIGAHVKPKAPPSKGWGLDRYDRLARLLMSLGITPVEITPSKASALGYARHVRTPEFDDVLAVLAAADCYVGNEGALHHASAAVGTPAVVLAGGYISRRVTGYPDQTWLFTGRHPLGHGCRFVCAECEVAMERIKVRQAGRAVLEATRST